MTQDEGRRTVVGRGSRRAAQVCAAAVAALLITSCGAADDPKAAAASSAPASASPSASPKAPAAPVGPGEVRIGGEVDKPYTVTLADLRKLPQVEASVEFVSAKGDQKHTYRGVPLHEVLKAAQPRFDQSKKNGQLRGVVAATGGGDYRAVFAWAELDPGFARSQILLAVSEDGTAFEDAAGPRLVVPQDTRGGRYVSDLNQLWVGTVDPVVDGAR